MTAIASPMASIARSWPPIFCSAVVCRSTAKQRFLNVSSKFSMRAPFVAVGDVRVANSVTSGVRAPFRSTTLLLPRSNDTQRTLQGIAGHG